MAPSGTVTAPPKEELEKLVSVLAEHQPFTRRVIPVRSNWASKMGHPCERNLFYWRHDWEKAEARDWKGIGIRGNLIADWWKRYMMEKGFKIAHDQLPLPADFSRDYEIGGRIDGRIGWASGPLFLYEFKTVSSHYYGKINSYEDFARMKPQYLRQYPSQLQTYLTAYDEELALFILCNPETLEWKVIPVNLDRAHANELLAKAKRVNAAFAANTAPDRIPFSATCVRCEFKTLCLPDIKNEGAEEVWDEDMIQLAQERKQLRAAWERYDEVDAELKTLAKLREKSFNLGGEFFVEITRSTKTSVDLKKMPLAVKQPYMVTSPTVRVEISEIEQ